MCFAREKKNLPHFQNQQYINSLIVRTGHILFLTIYQILLGISFWCDHRKTTFLLSSLNAFVKIVNLFRLTLSTDCQSSTEECEVNYLKKNSK
jgi:hypothetical protein